MSLISSHILESLCLFKSASQTGSLAKGTCGDAAAQKGFLRIWHAQPSHGLILTLDSFITIRYHAHYDVHVFEFTIKFSC